MMSCCDLCYKWYLESDGKTIDEEAYAAALEIFKKWLLNHTGGMKNRNFHEINTTNKRM